MEDKVQSLAQKVNSEDKISAFEIGDNQWKLFFFMLANQHKCRQLIYLKINLVPGEKQLILVIR